VGGMKYGYTCQCGWKLTRGHQTRGQYAAEKAQHANSGCEALQKELERSSKASQTKKT